jgi:co-chaperonin GroES (HSP10)
MAAALEVVHTKDPKEVLWEEAAPLAEHIAVYGDDCLIAVFNRGEGGETKTQGGIILTAQTLAEDDFQGKVGLLMKVGPEFETKDGNAKFFGDKMPKVGDWVMFRVGDTYSFKVRKKTFRMCEAKMLRAGVSKPDVIW